jgi:hypothetical protein
MEQEMQELLELLKPFYYTAAFATVILAFLWKPMRERGISVGSILCIYIEFILFIYCIFISIIGILNGKIDYSRLGEPILVSIFFILSLFGAWYTREKPDHTDVLLMAIGEEWDRMAKRGVDQREIQRLKNMSIAELAQEIDEYGSVLVGALDFVREKAEIMNANSQKLSEHEEYHPGIGLNSENDMWLTVQPKKPFSLEILLTVERRIIKSIGDLAKIRSVSS